MLDRLAERAGLKEGATVVVDLGMAYDENIVELKKRELHYVIASRRPERNRWLADFEDTEDFTPVLREPSPLNPGQKKSTMEVKTRTENQQTYVLCRSEQRIAKDRAIRTKHEARCSPISTNPQNASPTEGSSRLPRSTRRSDD